MKRLYWYVVVAMLAISITAIWALIPDSLSFAGADDQNERLPFVLLGIKHNMANVHSAIGIFTMTDEMSEEMHSIIGGPGSQTRRFNWSFSGEKFKEERIRTVNGIDTDSVTESFDGQDGFVWRPSEGRAAVYDSPGLSAKTPLTSEISVWLALEHKHSRESITWNEMIEKSQPRLIGQEDLDGDLCYRIEGITKDIAHIWWVATDRGFYVKKHEWTWKNADGSSNMWSTTMTAISRFEGDIWLPTRIVERCWRVEADGTRNLRLTKTLVAEELAVNIPIDPKNFTIGFPKDARVAHPRLRTQ
jgi:hypothetical protein